MAGFNPIDALNKNSKAAGEEPPRGRFRTKDIKLQNIYYNEKNFYPQEDIEEKAAEIYAIGLLQNLVVTYEPTEEGEYKLISGERRYRALRLLTEQGHTEFETVTCNVRNIKSEYEEVVELIIANSSRNKTDIILLQEEKELKNALEQMKKNKIPLKGYDLQSGRLRDVIAKILNKSASKIAQIEAINNNLSDGLKQEVQKGNLGFSAAYELSKMDKEKQEEEYERIKARDEAVTVAAVKNVLDSDTTKTEETESENVSDSDTIKIEENESENVSDSDTTESEEIEPNPVTATSLCYSCTKWSTCDEKGTTVIRCGSYKDKREEYKTEEQRYNEEQDEIDRQTKRKLQEMEDAEKMTKTPQEKEPEVREIRISSMSFEEFEAEKRHIIPLNNDKYHAGDILKMWEYKAGEQTGRYMKRRILNVLKECKGIEEGYCVVEIDRHYDIFDYK
ncbi:MAG: ParB N-terminal domain-containing protein [Lachnospiraceae bacterium]|nr:ParB N-terminal domain-containing protein [Lachnospiraceae bacterium]